ncbi:hypothetical protein IIE18_13530 [Pseudomonas sp. V1]|uniref:hypothetical protein n=1 Tax=Pseudomonas arcuscaelestis TaxID=2710591 RepID=UPI00193FD0B1|nr:hypothetical protein [Pseudomonas arcuscaelestis]MBM3106157.1 hypothetical protein [Pseudomonas arcuscaelestis]
MQTAIHPAFQQKIAVLAALLERSKEVRAEAHAKVGHSAPLFQAVNAGGAWDVIEIATGSRKGYAFKYPAAMKFVDAMEAAATRKLVGRQ